MWFDNEVVTVDEGEPATRRTANGGWPMHVQNVVAIYRAIDVILDGRVLWPLAYTTACTTVQAVIT